MSRIAFTGYTLCGVASIILGLVYLMRTEFMPYHAEAVRTDWASLPSGTRALIGALMNVLGAAWVSVGIAVLALVAIAYRSGNMIARWLVPVVLIALYGSILIVTLQVQVTTGAATPWMTNAFAVALAVLCLIIDAPWTSHKRNTAA